MTSLLLRRRAFLREFAEAGGALDVVFIPLESLALHSERAALHREAAVNAMKQLQKEADARADSMLPQPDWRIQIHHEAPEGRPISWSDLLGTRSSHGLAEGLYSAFADPPYGLRLEARERESKFNEFLELVVGVPSTYSEIYEWSTDWSNYFDAGREWWGSRFWTILADNGTTICAIGASTTD